MELKKELIQLENWLTYPFPDTSLERQKRNPYLNTDFSVNYWQGKILAIQLEGIR